MRISIGTTSMFECNVCNKKLITPYNSGDQSFHFCSKACETDTFDKIAKIQSTYPKDSWNMRFAQAWGSDSFGEVIIQGDAYYEVSCPGKFGVERFSFATLINLGKYLIKYGNIVLPIADGLTDNVQNEKLFTDFSLTSLQTIAGRGLVAGVVTNNKPQCGDKIKLFNDCYKIIGIEGNSADATSYGLILKKLV